MIKAFVLVVLMHNLYRHIADTSINQSEQKTRRLNRLPQQGELLGEKRSQGNVPRELVRCSLFCSFLVAMGGL